MERLKSCGVMGFVYFPPVKIANIPEAGAGKTILAYAYIHCSLKLTFGSSVIVNYLQQRFQMKSDVGIAFIYCNYKEEPTVQGLLGSLLQQVLRQRPQISDDVRRLYDNYSKINAVPAIAEYLALLQSELQFFERFFLVIDALDECTQREDIRGTFLSKLKILQPTLRLLITSRPHIRDVESTFDSLVLLKVEAAQKDVRLYLECRINKETRLNRNVEKDASLKDDIIKTILDKAKGMSIPQDTRC